MEIDISKISEQDAELKIEEKKEDSNEEVLVYVNFDSLNDDYTNEDLSNFRLIGIDTDEPILQIGNKVFGGIWKETVGTAVFFEETAAATKRCYFSPTVSKPFTYAAKTQKSLLFKRIFIAPKKTVPEPETSATDIV